VGDKPGAAQRLVRRLAFRYAAIGRTVIAALAGTLGVVAVPRAAPVVAAVVALSLVYSWFLVRRNGLGALLALDVVVVCAACLTQRWTVPAGAVSSNQGWVIALASITVVAYQWHTRPAVSVAAVAVTDAAFLAGVLLALPGHPGAALVMVAWLPVEAALSRLLWVLVRRGGARADRLTARAERARRTEAVARAARADELAHVASLHDNAASTLLMVGLGQVGAADPWLRAQARRDLASLGHWSIVDEKADVIPALCKVIATSLVTVTTELPDSLTAPAGVCGALCGSVREALTNIARHAGPATARVRVAGEAGRVAVEVTDDGVGVAPDTVPPNRFGVSGSIVERMALVGGRAEVSSAPGRGTVVRLEWPS
jgi:signal transduction histidine kinase